MEGREHIIKRLSFANANRMCGPFSASASNLVLIKTTNDILFSSYQQNHNYVFLATLDDQKNITYT